MPFVIETLQTFKDNYIHLVTDPDLGLAMVVDPGDADVVMRALKERELYLALILNTHHHPDHTAGNEKLQMEFGAPVIAPYKEKAIIPCVSRGVENGDVVTFSALRGEVIECPGHTDGHVSYYFPQMKALFCGDTLFTLGCGRLTEGRPAQMWETLKRLRELPDDTQLYCGHEYGEMNAKFALVVDKDNADLKARAEEIASLRRQGLSSVPTLLAAEKKCNPFLRVDQPEFRNALAKTGLAPEDADPAAVFGMLRSTKDHFGQSAL